MTIFNSYVKLPEGTRKVKSRKRIRRFLEKLGVFFLGKWSTFMVAFPYGNVEKGGYKMENILASSDREQLEKTSTRHVDLFCKDCQCFRVNVNFGADCKMNRRDFILAALGLNIDLDLTTNNLGMTRWNMWGHSGISCLESVGGFRYVVVAILRTR